MVVSTSAMMRRWRLRALFLVSLTSLTDCKGTKGNGDDARGLGLAEARLSVAQQVRVYATSVRAAFDVGPELTLLTDTVFLPRWSGYDGGAPMPAELLAALKKAGVVRGACAPLRASERRAPTCTAGRAGYVARFSPIFQRGRDTLQLYLLSEIFATTDGPGQQPFSFEMAYQVLPTGTTWRVVREGRVRQSGNAK